MEIVIKPHSFIDIITNSSTEIYVENNYKTLNVIIELIIKFCILIMNYKDRKIILVREDSNLNEIIEFIRNNENKIIKKDFFVNTLESFPQFAFDIETGDIVSAIDKKGNLLTTGNVLFK